MCEDDNGKNGEKDKGDEDMKETNKLVDNTKKQYSNTSEIKNILEKGMKRYDKSLEKLSKN